MKLSLAVRAPCQAVTARQLCLSVLIATVAAGCGRRLAVSESDRLAADDRTTKFEVQSTVPADAAAADSAVVFMDASSARPSDIDHHNFAGEGFAGRARVELEKLLSLGLGPAPATADSWHSLPKLSSQFTCGPLRWSEARTVYHGHEISVKRVEQALLEPRRKALEGLKRALAELRRPFAANVTPRCSLHFYELNQDDQQFVGRVHVEISGKGTPDLIEYDGHWEVVWKRGSELADAELHSIDVLSYDETWLHRKRTWFSDCTASIFEQEDSFRSQMLPSNTHWRRRIERHHIIDKSGHHGLAVGDINQDGLDDLYVCQPGGLPNRLYLHAADGTVRDVSAAAGCNFLDNTRCALFIDFDNDGDQDLVMATVSGLLFLANDGRGRFSLVNNITAIVDAYCLAAADFDQDGDLDIYACRYYQADADPLSLPIPTPYFHAENGGRNYLIRNDGNWRTSNATEAVGLDHNNSRFSYAAIWIDVDQDGDQDLYVANDFGRDNLYRNDKQGARGWKFTDVAEEWRMHDGAFGMSADGGDFDRDGREDIYVANMFSSAGSRISRMPEFKPGIKLDDRAKFQHLARGNTLLWNSPRGGFVDVSREAGVTQGRWSWGALFQDIDNNGWPDLIVANGYITGDKSGDDL